MLPAKPSFFKYIGAMCVINAAATLGAAALALKLTSGYCLYGATEFVYYAIYPPVRPRGCRALLNPRTLIPKP